MSYEVAADKSHCTVEGCGREVWLYPTKGWVHWSWAAADHEAVPQASKLKNYHVVITIQEPEEEWTTPQTYDLVIGLPTDDLQQVYHHALTHAAQEFYDSVPKAQGFSPEDMVVLFYGAWPMRKEQK